MNLTDAQRADLLALLDYTQESEERDAVDHERENGDLTGHIIEPIRRLRDALAINPGAVILRTFHGGTERVTWDEFVVDVIQDDATAREVIGGMLAGGEAGEEFAHYNEGDPQAYEHFTILDRESLIVQMRGEMTPEHAAHHIYEGGVVRVKVGEGEGDPILMVRIGSAYGRDHILTTAVGGWCEGVTEPVCELGSSYLVDKFLGGTRKLTAEPDVRKAHGLRDYEG